MSYCTSSTSNTTYDRTFGSNYSVPTFKQKVGEVLVYYGDLEGEYTGTDSVSSVATTTFLQNPSTSSGTTNTSSSIVDTNTVKVDFDTTDVTLSPGEEYLVSVTITFNTGMVLVRSFQVIVTDYFGKTPSSITSSSIPAYVSLSDNVVVTTTTSTSTEVPVFTTSSFTTCSEISNYTVEDATTESTLTNIPASAGAARVDILGDVEFSVNGSVTPNGIADAITGQSIWLDNIEFTDFRVTGISGTGTYSFKVTYWTCNPYQ